MKKLVLVILLVSLTKAFLLFLEIYSERFFPANQGVLRFLVFLVLVFLVDWITMNQLKEQLVKARLLKVLLFNFLSFSSVLFLTGPMWSLYNYVEGKPVDNVVFDVPTSAIILFLSLGLAVSLVSSLIWTRKNSTH